MKWSFAKNDPQKRPRISLCKNGKRYTRYVHTVILNTFVGSRPVNMECCHNDGNPANNKLNNLRWDTSKANGADMVKHGTSTRGIKNPQNKLTEKQVLKIRSLLKETKLRQWEIADKFSVTRSAINCINNGYTWKHLKE